MNLILLDRRCKGCGVKLTRYEIEEKNVHCMDCFDSQEETDDAKSWFLNR